MFPVVLLSALALLAPGAAQERERIHQEAAPTAVASQEPARKRSPAATEAAVQERARERIILQESAIQPPARERILRERVMIEPVRVTPQPTPLPTPPPTSFELEIEWPNERPAFVHGVFLAGDAFGPALEPPELAHPQLGALYVWSGMALWLVVEVESAPEGRTLCALWSDPNGDPAATVCQRLPVGPARLAFEGPETYGWPTDRYPVRLQLMPEPYSSAQQPYVVADVHYALGTRLMAHMANGGSNDIPIFPWPPPAPTTRAAIDRALAIGAAADLGGVARRLTIALARAGYTEHSFYSVPGGFALATRLEQILPDGSPQPDPPRWSLSLPPRPIFSLGDFVTALFSAPEGNYRVIVFIVTDQTFATSGEEASRETALAWIDGGLQSLPPTIAAIPVNDGHACMAFIYQYRQIGAGNEPIANPDGAPRAVDQLGRSRILVELGS